ncbi:COP9 signalosome (CSN) subunit [Myotisia sp. PD_48]|nr:COP9 signalosome (CSN) subunit [Myotisia sp. PD_48]
MGSILTDFKEAQTRGSGNALAATLVPVAPSNDPNRLRSFYQSTNSVSAPSDIKYALLHDRRTGSKLSKSEGSAWVDIFVAFWKAVGELLKIEDDTFSSTSSSSRATGKGNWSSVFTAWKELSNVVIRSYSTNALEAWTLPCLYVVGKHLRLFAMKADAENLQDPTTFDSGFQEDIVSNVSRNAKLEETSTIISRMYSLCLHDRAPIEESRKWGVYSTVTLAFKTYFKLGSESACKHLLQVLEASQADLPSLDSFPKSHIVTFKYYLGVICFLEEDYTMAEQHLTYAWKLCPSTSIKNKELILTYLVPCHIVTNYTLPSSKLLARFPRLERLFRPLCLCIRRGDLAGFDAAMVAGEDEFAKRKIYLPLERGRDLAVRNLFRKVFLIGGYDPPVNGQPPIRRSRVPVTEFAAAIRLGTKKTEEKTRIDLDEVECYLSNMIFKNLMKGYIARERGIVVLSKGGTAFPGTGV